MVEFQNLFDLTPSKGFVPWQRDNLFTSNILSVLSSDFTHGRNWTYLNKIWNTAFVFAFCCGVCGATWCQRRIPWGCRWLVGLSHSSGIEESCLTLVLTTPLWKPGCSAATTKLHRPPAGSGSLVLKCSCQGHLEVVQAPSSMLSGTGAVPARHTPAEKWYSGSRRTIPWSLSSSGTCVQTIARCDTYRPFLRVPQDCCPMCRQCPMCRRCV